MAKIINAYKFIGRLPNGDYNFEIVLDDSTVCCECKYYTVKDGEEFCERAQLRCYGAGEGCSCYEGRTNMGRNK